MTPLQTKVDIQNCTLIPSLLSTKNLAGPVTEKIQKIFQKFQQKRSVF